MVESLLGCTYPQLGIRVVNVGTSGNTSRDLKGRWQKDVIDLKPDWLSIMIGTNDVWRQFDLPRQEEIHVQPAEYEANMRSIIEQVKPSLDGLILMTPFFVEPNRKDAMRTRMDLYGSMVKKLAGEYDAVFVDTQAAFDACLEHYYSGTLSWDRVHPNQTGHMIIAKAFLNAIGLSGESPVPLPSGERLGEGRNVLSRLAIVRRLSWNVSPLTPTLSPPGRGRKDMTKLSVNVNKVATLRNTRHLGFPTWCGRRRSASTPGGGDHDSSAAGRAAYSASRCGRHRGAVALVSAGGVQY